jgi:hypothetical protein
MMQEIAAEVEAVVDEVDRLDDERHNEGDCLDAENVPAAPDSGWIGTKDTGGWSSGAVDPAEDTADLPEGVKAGLGRSQPRKRMRERGDKGHKDVNAEEGKHKEKQAEATVLFEGQRKLGKGLAEALVMVRERGWLRGVEYSGRQSDFKGNQQKQVC